MRFFFLFLLSFLPVQTLLANGTDCVEVISALSEVESFKQKWGPQSVDNPLHNKQYIKLMMQLQEIPAFYFQIENSVLKELNDKVIIDKELVTDLDTFLKTIILNDIEQSSLLKKHLIAKYSDYKTLHLAFNQDSEEIRQELESIYQNRMNDFERQVILLELERNYLQQPGLVHSPRHWYLAGFGNTNDKANFATRLSRGLTLKNNQSIIIDFDKNISTFHRHLNELETLRSKFSFLEKSDLFQYLDGATVFSLNFVELLRKYKGLHLEEMTQQRFQLNLSSETIAAIQKYYETLDIFSPSLLIEERIRIDMSKTISGNISIDLVGMGARNFQYLMAAIIRERSSTVDDILKAIRRSEIQATEELLEMRNRAIRSIHMVEKVRKGKDFNVSERLQYTGDDLVYFPTGGLLQKRHKIAILKNLAQMNEIGNYRPVFLAQTALNGSEINHFERIEILVQGEILEKKFRMDLEKKFSFQLIKDLVIGVDINIDHDGQLLFDLFITQGRSSLELDQKVLNEMTTGKIRKIEFLK